MKLKYLHWSPSDLHFMAQAWMLLTFAYRRTSASFRFEHPVLVADRQKGASVGESMVCMSQHALKTSSQSPDWKTHVFLSVPVFGPSFEQF
jgi:hypothetical protein